MQIQTDAAAFEATVQRLAVLRDMPIFYSGLVVENTTRCNAKCAMCYQAAGPKGSDTWGKQALSTDELVQLVRDAIQIETLYPRFHLSGGEAFINVDSCLEVFRAARDVGFLDITTTTNAYWAKRPERAVQVCRALREAGVTSMEISWDYWHSPYITPEAVSNALEITAAHDIETNLRILCTKSHPYSEALDMLRPDALAAASRISGGPVFATGRAATEIDAGDFHRQNDISGNCHSVLNLTVNAKGNVFPCCAGLDQTDYVFGNVRDAPISQIAQSLNASPLVRTIVFSGVAALAPMIEEMGVAVGEEYNGICHMCWSIFSNPDRVAALEAYFERAASRALETALEQLMEGAVQ
ncbi:radical SAM protein [Tropicibacter oceani]|uniref:Radical SAM protein n=1 Tax=Tropicibacter oceani TaxID=3058420 RepID=A0ABY8QMY6_9RHOB|nr:radical SAM protein [Tropicibacter oceani]WGW06000.1 radical SAM protein [Tropicibacter oceani]